MKIISIKNEKVNVLITLDTGKEYLIIKKIWEDAPFRVGQNLSEDEISELLNLDEIFRIKRTALRILARREHAKHEIFNKLKKRGFSEHNINYVINLLENENFINDKRFAEAYIGFNFYRKRKSLKQLSYELHKKGVDKSLYLSNLNEISEEDIYNNALTIALKKIRIISDKRNKDKILLAVRNNLLYKAYPIEIVNRVLTEINQRLEHD